MITDKNNPNLWNTLRMKWITEGHPGYLTIKGLQYQVIQLHETGKVAFVHQDKETMHDGSSVENMGR